MIYLDNLAERRRDVRPAKGGALSEELAALKYVLATEGWLMRHEQRSRLAQRIRTLGGDAGAITVLPPLLPSDVSDLYDEDDDWDF